MENFEKFAGVLSNLPKKWKDSILRGGGGENSLKIQTPVNLTTPKKLLNLFKEGNHIAVIGFIDETPAFIIQKASYGEGKYFGQIITDNSIKDIEEKRFKGYSRYSGHPDYRIEREFGFNALVDKIPKNSEYKIYLFSVDENRTKLRKERQENKKDLTVKDKKFVPYDETAISGVAIAKYIKSKIGNGMDEFAKRIKDNTQEVMDQLLNALQTGQKQDVDTKIDKLANDMKAFSRKLSETFSYITTKEISVYKLQQYINKKQQLKNDPNNSDLQHSLKWNDVTELLKKLRELTNSGNVTASKRKNNG